MRYVALLRGINVGGNTMIRMSELKTSFENLGFRNVASYINSGNLAFDTAKADEEKLVAKIEEVIKQDFGLDIHVMVRDRAAIEEVLTNNPFEDAFESHKEMHVLFMKGRMTEVNEKHLLEQQTSAERFAVRGREIYCHLKRGVADSLLGKGFIERKLKIAITARNWRTVERLATL